MYIVERFFLFLRIKGVFDVELLTVGNCIEVSCINYKETNEKALTGFNTFIWMGKRRYLPYVSWIQLCKR